MSIETLYSLFKQYPSAQTDTRQLHPGSLFFALKGDNFDGNQFARQALEAGAVAAIIDNPSCLIDERTILVDDVLTTLQALAKKHRQQFSIPFLAITGSNGKTTSKELVHAVLATTFKTYTTQGNLNNHIGIPLTLLRVQSDAEIVVIEMGANHQKEIAGYCRYAMPTYGIITNCGKAHLEGFGGVEGVKKGKGELYDFILAQGGTIIRNNDYDYLLEMSKGISSVLTYGSNAADTVGIISQADPFLRVCIQHTLKGMPPELASIQTQLVGDYNLSNVLLAVTVGIHFGVSPEKIKWALENYQPTNSRSQLLKKDSNSIILDAYNANPNSMQVAIENFNKMQASHKVLMLGSMAELGVDSLYEHQQIVNLIGNCSFQSVVLVGEQFAQVNHPYLQLSSAKEAADWFRLQNFKNTHLLIKGSRSMKMETILS